MANAPGQEALSPFARRAFGAAMAAPSWHDWRWQLRRRLTAVDEILALLPPDLVVAPATAAAMRRIAATLPLSVTPSYLALADPRDPRDPILAQVLPDPAEAVADGAADPFGEAEREIAPGVVHRYPDRALFLLTNFCTTLCRHCMRRREWLPRFERLDDAQVEAGVAAIAARPQIRDVLLSGGDPLNLGTAFLNRVLCLLRARTDLDCIRLGSRVPVTLPQRIDDELLGVLAAHAPLFLNTHFNHARELTPAAVAAVQRLTRAGVVVSNQGVLLRGVNDTPEDLLALSRGLLRAGVRAYYLHHCDPVQGARHFRVGIERGRRLVESLHGKVSGLAIPRFVVDLPGGAGKVDAAGPHACGRRGDRYRFRSPLDGREVAVDGSEGSFAGVGAWAAIALPAASA